MDIIKRVCNDYFKDFAGLSDSAEYKAQSNVCNEIYEDLIKELSEEQQKKLYKLNFENFMLSGQWLTDGFNEGIINGFKFAVKLIIDSLR